MQGKSKSSWDSSQNGKPTSRKDQALRDVRGNRAVGLNIDWDELGNLGEVLIKFVKG